MHENVNERLEINHAATLQDTQSRAQINLTHDEKGENNSSLEVTRQWA